MPKITAICGGGDWNDASVDFVILPEGSSIKSLYAEYEEFIRSLPREGQARYDACRSFPQWLKEKKGATEPGADLLQEFWE